MTHIIFQKKKENGKRLRKDREHRTIFVILRFIRAFTPDHSICHSMYASTAFRSYDNDNNNNNNANNK